MYIYIHMYVYMNIYIYVHTHTYTHKHTHTYTHIPTHTHRHTHTSTNRRSSDNKRSPNPENKVEPPANTICLIRVLRISRLLFLIAWYRHWKKKKTNSSVKENTFRFCESQDCSFVSPGVYRHKKNSNSSAKENTLMRVGVVPISRFLWYRQWCMWVCVCVCLCVSVSNKKKKQLRPHGRRSCQDQ